MQIENFNEILQQAFPEPNTKRINNANLRDLVELIIEKSKEKSHELNKFTNLIERIQKMEQKATNHPDNDKRIDNILEMIKNQQSLTDDPINEVFAMARNKVDHEHLLNMDVYFQMKLGANNLKDKMTNKHQSFNIHSVKGENVPALTNNFCNRFTNLPRGNSTSKLSVDQNHSLFKESHTCYCSCLAYRDSIHSNCTCDTK